MKGDPIELLNMLEDKYSQYGAVKIVVNDSWNSPFTFRYVDKEITTRIQCLHKLKDGKVIYSFCFLHIEGNFFHYLLKSYCRPLNKKSELIEFRRMKPWPRTSVASTGTSPIHKVSTMTPRTRLSIGIWLQMKNVIILLPADEKKQVTVEYAADLSASVYGSGFPVQKMTNWIDADFEYEKNYWNLNNISKSPSSLLSIC